MEDGLLGFLSSPAGQGLLSAAFTGAATAQRGTPWNNLGKAGVGGLIGYSNATTRQEELDKLNREKAKELKRDNAVSGMLPSIPENMRPFVEAYPELAAKQIFGKEQDKPQLVTVQTPSGPMQRFVRPTEGDVGAPVDKESALPWYVKKGANGMEIDPAYASFKKMEGAESLQVRRELADQASADRRMIAGMVNARQEQKNTPKLPTRALQMQQEELDAIGTSSTINADLSAIGRQVESGKLDLGLVSNLTAKAKNYVGASDESSRNLASFQATLEKLRNDSLRLNKGVQTEGDSARAWNELLTNINDRDVVKQRLGEIQKINQRAANLRQMNVDGIRANYGMEPMDTSGYRAQPAAVGGAQDLQSAAAQTFDTKPPAKDFKGKFATSPDGKRFKSDGMIWKEVN